MFVSYGKTESCDDLPIVIWLNEPTDDQVEAAYKELLPDEFEEVGFVNFKVEQAEVRL